LVQHEYMIERVIVKMTKGEEGGTTSTCVEEKNEFSNLFITSKLTRIQEGIVHYASYDYYVLVVPLDNYTQIYKKYLYAFLLGRTV
jgi:hypothetical protein